MRKITFSKVLSGLFISAICALFYVHQEVEIVKTGFILNKNQRELSLLLDQYRSLVYNLSRLESPKRIEDNLCVNEIMLSMPKIENIRHFNNGAVTHAAGEIKTAGKPSFLARVFDRFSLEAEAKVAK